VLRTELRESKLMYELCGLTAKEEGTTGGIKKLDIIRLIIVEK